MCTEMTGRTLTFIRHRRKNGPVVPRLKSENEGMILNDSKEKQEGK